MAPHEIYILTQHNKWNVIYQNYDTTQYLDSDTAQHQNCNPTQYLDSDTTQYQNYST